MSNHLAIASVTAVLRNLLDNGVSDHDLSSIVNSGVSVSAVAPDRISTEGSTPDVRLNLYQYRATPNQGWRNVDLPSRNSRGARLTNQPLALDLHYFLTAYASGDAHAEILLGCGMQVLHENSVIPRGMIRDLLTPSNLAAGGLPTELSASELADQVEQITLTLQPMSAEDISKLWTAFQSNYRPSAAYRASVVIIESDASTRSPLPVRARNLYIRSFQQPVISELRSQQNAAADILANQPILPGHRLVIMGSQLKSDETAVRIGEFEIEPADENITDSQIIVAIPAGLPAGPHGVQVLHRQSMGTPPILHTGTESNLCPMALRPVIIPPVTVTAAVVSPENIELRDVKITLTEEVGETQRVVLLLNQLLPASSPPDPSDPPPRAYTFRRLEEDLGSPPGPSNSVVVQVRDVANGDYLVRVQIDGAESLLGIDANGFYASPTLTVS